MTLHWWMHWFWVTTLLTIILSSGSSHAAPATDPPTSEENTTDVQAKQADRQGRAMYFAKTTTTPVTTKNPPLDTNTTQKVEDAPQIDQKPNITLSLNQTEISNSTDVVHPAFQVSESNTTIEEIVILPKQTVAPETNHTEEQNATAPAANKKRHNLTRDPEVKEIDNIDGAAESRIVTEKPLSLETAFLQTRIPPNIESSRRIIDQTDGPYNGSGMDTGEIAGISFAALVLVALAGSTAFVLYRRRYLNKPQTLNDKCSNPDSSGYLDDSTVRDNSEEMYSLDNDSFLNSLEAMTIQNYWTDTVKHTKL